MKLSFEQIKSITVGATRIEKENGGICFHRFSAEQENSFKEINESLLSTSGIRLRFKTNSETLFLKGKVKRGSPVRSFYTVDIRVDGKLFDSISNFDEKMLDKVYSEKEYDIKDFEKEILLKKGEKTVEITLPYSVKVELEALSLSDNSFFTPVKRKSVLMAYGDSITHGFDAIHPSLKYVTRLCDALGAEEYNRGIGGFCFSPELVEKKDDINPDYLIVAYGVNDFSHRNKDEFRENCRAFFKNLTKNYGHVPTFALSPIWASHATKNDIFGDFSCIGQIIFEETKAYDNVVFIDCFDFVPHDGDCYGDGVLHPNDKGFEYYFKMLYLKISEYMK